MNTDKEKETPEIVEGEILDEGLESLKSTKPKSSPKPQSKTIYKLPWILSSFLVVFIGGLFMEPWVELGIERLFPGTIPPKEVSQIAPDPKVDKNETAIKTLENQLSQIQASVEANNQRTVNIENNLLQLNEGLGSLQKELSTLKGMVENAPLQPTAEGEITADNLTALEDRLNNIEGEITTFKAELETAPLTQNNDRVVLETPQYIEQLSGLEARLQKMEVEAKVEGKSNPLPISLATLARTVESGQTFEQPLLNVRAHFEGLDAIDRATAQPHFNKLSLLAKGGVSSLEDLRREFGGLIATSLRAKTSGEDAGVWDKTTDWFSSLIVVRKTGEVKGEDDEALFARAERRLLDKNLEATIILVEGLSAPALTAMTPWLRGAKNRIEVMEAVANLIPIVFNEGEG